VTPSLMFHVKHRCTCGRGEEVRGG
jgi:hypothetical protein